MKDILIEYHRPGKNRRAYRERLLADQADVKILLMDSADAPLKVRGIPVLELGAPILWFVFPDKWYDVGRFHLADRTFTGWYTNLCTPVVMDGPRWGFTDLFLDLWIPASGGAEWLDEDEFDAAAAAGTLAENLARAARAERARIKSLVARNAWPPDICRTTDLESASF